MSNKPDEEEEENNVGVKTRKAWFAGHADTDNFGAGFRGVPGVRHGGSKTVTHEDITGSMDLCWCGKPFDHDWAGKSGGRPHPRKEDPLIKKDDDMPTSTAAVAPTEEQPRIERRALRAYNADLADIILTAVNEYHVKYRITAHSVILFPPDGSQHYAINARNSDRQVKGARVWFARHCVPQDISIKQAAKKAPSNKPVDEDAVKELAEALNSPEHLEKLDEPAKPAGTPPKPSPTMVATKKAASAPAAEAAPVEEPAESPTEATSEEWVPYYTGKGKGSKKGEGKKHPFYLTNGTLIKCVEHNWLGKPTSAGGHTRTHHTDTSSLWGSEAKKKAINTYFTNKAAKKVEDAIGLLYEAIGVTPQTAVDTSALESEIKDLKAKNQDLSANLVSVTTERDELKTKVTDMETKAALAREALGL